MKIAYIIPELHKPSGWRTLSTGVVQAMAQHGGVTAVLVVAQADAAAARELWPAAHIVVLPRIQQMAVHLWRTWPSLWQGWQKLADVPRVDLVHSLEAYPTGLIGHWLAQQQRVPHVLTAVGTYSVIWHDFWADRQLYQRVLHHASAICPISHGTRHQMQQLFAPALAATPIEVILPGTPYAHQISNVPQRNTAVANILAVGQVKPRKGYHTALAAFAQIQQAIPHARFDIVGSRKQADYVQQLTDYITSHQLRHVHFWDVASAAQLRQLYQQATLFMLTPEADGRFFEGFGLVYLEAGAYGLPVVATRSGGVPDAVRHGQTGLLAAPGDASAIAAAALHLLRHPAERQQMGQANRRWAEQLTWQRFAAQQTAVYQKYQPSHTQRSFTQQR